MFASAGTYLTIYSLECSGLKKVLKYVPKSKEKIVSISWCHDNSYIAILQENAHPEIISSKDPNNLNLVHTISSIPEITALKFKSNTKRVLAIGTRNGDIMLYDTKNRCISKRLGKLSSEISNITFISSNELAVTTKNILSIFNLLDNVQIKLKNPESCTVLKSFNRSTAHIVVGCKNGTVIIWDVVGEKEFKRYKIHASEVRGIAISRNDKMMVTCGADYKICLIDNSTQECIFRKNLHQPVRSLDVSADDQHMVAGLEDGSIYVYNMTDHLKPQICSKMDPSSINQISFINGIGMEMFENESVMMEDDNMDEKITSKDKDIQSPIEDPSSSEESQEPRRETVDEQSLEVNEEKIKLDLIKLINANFTYLESQLNDHCVKLQTLISNELDSLYTVAARWECFKTMELDEIVRYICGIISASSETRLFSQRSDRTNL